MSDCASAKSFYEAQYSAGGGYADYGDSASHPFRPALERLIAQFGNPRGAWLEVGCGRGALQDVVSDYTGVDLAESCARFLRKAFVPAAAERLPFPDDRFDGVWSYAVLEHVEHPERALSEMRRVTRPGGALILAPAWHCRPWAGRTYAWKPYAELSTADRFRKATIPLRNLLLVRVWPLLIRRLLWALAYAARRSPTALHPRPLTPNYSECRCVDADARHDLDPFDAFLWFRSRGDLPLVPRGWGAAFRFRSGAVVIRVCKTTASASETRRGVKSP